MHISLIVMICLLVSKEGFFPLKRRERKKKPRSSIWPPLTPHASPHPADEPGGWSSPALAKGGHQLPPWAGRRRAGAGLSPGLPGGTAGRGSCRPPNATDAALRGLVNEAEKSPFPEQLREIAKNSSGEAWGGTGEGHAYGHHRRGPPRKPQTRSLLGAPELAARARSALSAPLSVLPLSHPSFSLSKGQEEIRMSLQTFRVPPTWPLPQDPHSGFPLLIVLFENLRPAVTLIQEWQ